MKDFSQTGEQGAILEWARERAPGRFLDIGATDGVTASNTRALASRGWSGVCVEPAAWAFDRLAALYHGWDTVQCVQACVVGEPGLVGFHYARDLVSTTEDRYAAIWDEDVAYHHVFVGGVTVRQLLDAVGGGFQFVNIDTEGTTLSVFDALRREPEWEQVELVCVEAEDGADRWTIQQLCLEGWERLYVSPNNVLLGKLGASIRAT